jgi:uncharacterized repeat protein (TIGR03833 family)
LASDGIPVRDAGPLVGLCSWIKRRIGFHRCLIVRGEGKIEKVTLPRACAILRFVNGQIRSSIKPGMTVLIVLKQDQQTGKLTKGVVKDILTKSPTHPHGIKVRLEGGAVGRVKEIVSSHGAASA